MNFNNLYKGKRIIVIGASRSTICDMKRLGVDLADYDMVVKVNHHWANIQEEEFKRTDAVYHGLRPEMLSPRQIKLIAQENFFVVTRPIKPTSSRFRRARMLGYRERRKRGFNKIKSLGVPIETISGGFYENISKQLGGLPLMGVLAILHIAKFNPKRLDCFGFDFYKSKYFPSKRRVKLRSSIPSSGGVHKLGLQKKRFLKMISEIECINMYNEASDLYVQP